MTEDTIQKVWDVDKCIHLKTYSFESLEKQEFKSIDWICHGCGLEGTEPWVDATNVETYEEIKERFGK